jgi:Kef-type K+ transport system membrane component KefB
VHAFLGAFLVGTALSGHSSEQEEAHEVITKFSLSFFAPVFFVSMGMNTNFITNFDLGLVALITAVAFASKLGAVCWGQWRPGCRSTATPGRSRLASTPGGQPGSSSPGSGSTPE